MKNSSLWEDFFVFSIEYEISLCYNESEIIGNRGQKMSQKIDMLNGGLVKKIIVFTIPIMLQGFLQSVYNAADLIIVGHFSGDVALSAVGATTSIYNVMTSLFMGIAAGVDVVSSFFYGRGDTNKVKQSIDTAVITALSLGIVAAVLGFFITDPVLRLMQTPDESGVLSNAVLYLKTLMFGVPFSLLFNFCAAIFRTAGETKRPFIYLMISGVVNVLLNLLFVAVFNMGVFGVAFATVISQALSAFLIFVRLIKNQGLFSFNAKNIDFSWTLLGRMVAIGLPAGLQSCAFSISNSFLQSGVNSFGKDAIAGSTAVATVEGLLWVTITSFQSAATTFVSQNLGAGKIDRSKKSILYTVSMTFLVGVVLGLSAYFLSDPIISIFIKDNPTAVAYAKERLSITFPLYCLAGVMGVLPGAIRGLGSSLPPSIISLVGACGIRIVWVYTIFQISNNLKTLYLVHPITWAITNTALIINLIIAYKNAKKKHTKNIYVRKNKRREGGCYEKEGRITWRLH